MTKTEYNLKEDIESGWLRVFKNNKQVGNCIDRYSALHMIWCEEGSDKAEFYSECDGVVFVYEVEV